MKTIQELLGQEYLKRFKIYYPQILFEPNWNALKDYRCPICGLKLKFIKDNTLAICKGKKHLKQFVITSKKLIEIVYKK